jgi:hypothetical protein
MTFFLAMAVVLRRKGLAGSGGGRKGILDEK